MTAMTIIGLLLQIAGTVIAGVALWEDFKQYSEDGRSVWPWFGTLLGGIRRLLGRTEVQHRHARITIDSAIGATSGVMEPAVVPADTDPLDVQVRYLRQTVDRLAAELASTRGDVTGVRNELDANVSALSRDIGTAREDLTRDLKEFATGRVGAELFGLVLVGAGTILGSLASLV